MQYSIDYSVAIARVFDDINFSDIEDALNGRLLSSRGSKDYTMPKEIIQKLADEMKRGCNIKLF